MGTANAILMLRARQALSGRWVIAVGLCFVFSIVNFVANVIPIIGILAISGPLMFGLYNTMLLIARGKDVVFSQLFDGFNRYIVSVLAFLCMCIFICLWSILLVIPGIIASISYSMTFFIIADNPNVQPLEAIRKSKQMMYGYKWKFFCLCCRFIGWALLCSLITFGIGFFWLAPYIYVSTAKFYDDIKHD